MCWGVVSPKSISGVVKKPLTRRDAGLGFGFFAFVFFILVGVTAHKKTKTESLKPNATPLAQQIPIAKDTNSSATIQTSQPTATKPPTLAPQVTIKGFGATQSDWNQNHTQDSRYATNGVYNPTAGLGPDDRHNAKYYLVSTAEGRITSYTMRFPNGQLLSASTLESMQEFPSDATVLWQQNKDTCTQMEIKSATLGSVLGSKAIGDPEGMVFIELYTSHSDATDTSYSKSNVNEGVFGLGNYSTANDAPSC